MEEGNRLIEGKYRGLQTITLFDGININVVEKFLFLETNPSFPNHLPSRYSI